VLDYARRAIDELAATVELAWAIHWHRCAERAVHAEVPLRPATMDLAEDQSGKSRGTRRVKRTGLRPKSVVVSDGRRGRPR